MSDIHHVTNLVVERLYVEYNEGKSWAMNINGNTIAVHGASESVYLMLDKMLGDDTLSFSLHRILPM